jgi:hypothetical protein
MFSLCCVQQIPEKRVVIIGQINTTCSNGVIYSNIQFCINDSIITSTYVDENLQFKLSLNIDDTMDVFYFSTGVDKRYVTSIVPSSYTTDTIHLQLEFPTVKYKKHLGKIVCPKCGQTDKVLKICYGLHANKIFKIIDNNKDPAYLHYDKKFFYSGTCISGDLNAKYYCIRDNIQF